MNGPFMLFEDCCCWKPVGWANVLGLLPAGFYMTCALFGKLMFWSVGKLTRLFVAGGMAPLR